MIAAQFCVVLVFMSSKAMGGKDDVDSVGDPTTCLTPLVKGLSNAAITASSNHVCCPPKSARLSGDAWSPASRSLSNQWLQFDLGTTKLVSGVVTMGRRNYAQWMQYYSIMYYTTNVMEGPGSKKKKMSKWVNVMESPGSKNRKIFRGNVDQHTMVTNMFIAPLRTRYIRVLPVASYNDPTFRVELLGC